MISNQVSEVFVINITKSCLTCVFFFSASFILKHFMPHGQVACSVDGEQSLSFPLNLHLQCKGGCH